MTNKDEQVKELPKVLFNISLRNYIVSLWVILPYSFNHLSMSQVMLVKLSLIKQQPSHLCDMTSDTKCASLS